MDAAIGFVGGYNSCDGGTVKYERMISRVDLKDRIMLWCPL